jgi:GntR family histidine utilization transcriptional repressor
MVMDYIEARIRNGEWQPGMRIESEHTLVAKLGVSRMTVNRALRELAASGLLRRTQGVGTFVANPKPQSPLFEIKSIDQEIRDTGGSYSCHVHHLQAEKASPDLAVGMGLDPYDPVYHSIIVHKRSNEPFQLADRYVHPGIAPGYIEQDFTAITPSAYLMKLCPATMVEHVIEALIPEVWVRNALAINAAEPCLVMHRKTWVRDRVATLSTFYYPGSRHRIGGCFKPVNGGEGTIV